MGYEQENQEHNGNPRKVKTIASKFLISTKQNSIATKKENQETQENCL
jgi:hypothetical protein